jgi:hypothetical protein
MRIIYDLKEALDLCTELNLPVSSNLISPRVKIIENLPQTGAR